MGTKTSMTMRHATVIDQSLEEQEVLQTYKVFAKKHDGSWGICGLEIEDDALTGFINRVQNVMKKSCLRMD